MLEQADSIVKSRHRHIDPQAHPEQIDATAFVAPGAVVVGNVTVGAEASLWFGVVVRGDVEAVRIGPQTNVPDGCILHADPGQPCLLGARVSLGHGALVHAAQIEDDVLIGMRATVLNGARVGSGSVIAAGALIPPGMVVPPHSLVMGLPGQGVRQVTEHDRERVRATAQHYVEYARRYRQIYATADHPRRPAGAANDASVSRLRRLAGFEGLNEAELTRVAGIGSQRAYAQNQVITEQGASDSDVFIGQAGLLEISVAETGQGEQPKRAIVNLGEGQVVGAMALIDHGPRSATVRCVSESCVLISIERDAFERLCAAEPHIGLIVYRNLAADLSFKLRHRHLAGR